MVTIMSENFAPMRTGTYPRKATMTRILIVEDEESYREPLVYQLTREGYDVSAAATGEEGLELFTKGGIDLVLLDLMLPGIDGTALCRRIREQSRVPIIMLTAKSAEIDKVVGLEIGADDYVTKPYSFRELLARIRAVMRRNQATAQASGTVDDDIPLVCGHHGGCIPFAASDPVHVLPACIVGSGVAGAMSMLFNCTLMAPHGGIFVFPVMGNPLFYLLALVVGTAISTVLLGVLKKNVEE